MDRGKTLETMTVWADANQRVMKEWVEGLRLYGELQVKAIEQTGKGIQATLADAVAKTKEIYARA